MTINYLRHKSMENYITNPKTGYVIKKNGERYNKLITANLLGIEEKNDNILAIGEKSDLLATKNLLSKGIIKDKNTNLRIYGNKLMAQQRRLKKHELVDLSIDKSIDIMLKIYDGTNETDITKSELKDLIYDTIIGNKPNIKPKSKVSKLENEIIIEPIIEIVKPVESVKSLSTKKKYKIIDD